jgi:hypothetical protein
MSDKDSKKPTEKREPGAPKQSGRVAYDSKGNPIWEWETSTGVFDRNVTTQRLKKLEAKLSLEETQPVPKPSGLSMQEPERLPGGGMNPYDTSGGNAQDAAPSSHPALAHKQAANKNKGVISNSLASKYASAAKKSAQAKPKGFWEKLRGRFGDDK